MENKDVEVLKCCNTCEHYLFAYGKGWCLQDSTDVEPYDSCKHWKEK